MNKIFQTIFNDSSTIDIQKLKIENPNPTQQRLLEEVAILYPNAHNKQSNIRPSKTASQNNRHQKIELPQLNDT